MYNDDDNSDRTYCGVGADVKPDEVNNDDDDNGTLVYNGECEEVKGRGEWGIHTTMDDDEDDSDDSVCVGVGVDKATEHKSLDGRGDDKGEPGEPSDVICCCWVYNFYKKKKFIKWLNNNSIKKKKILFFVFQFKKKCICVYIYIFFLILFVIKDLKTQKTKNTHVMKWKKNQVPQC